MKYNPSDAARACNVSVNTIRGWIRDHSEHFTSGARGESGNRLLSDKDMNTLKYIAGLRSEGLQKDAIGVRLQETAIGDIETIAPLQSPSIAIQAAPDATEHTPASIMVIEAINAIETRIEGRLVAVEAVAKEASKNRRDMVLMFCAGFCAACLVFLLLVALAALYGR
jgi:DNA-binding transcriptional MerR regulator